MSSQQALAAGSVKSAQSETVRDTFPNHPQYGKKFKLAKYDKNFLLVSPIFFVACGNGKFLLSALLSNFKPLFNL